jgi:hypothetical protein
VTALDKQRKVELIQRSLGIRHKLKVHESMKQPDTHEDLAIMLMAKWELEDELRAIEEMLAEARMQNVKKKRGVIEKEGAHIPGLPPEEPGPKKKSRK